MNTASAHVLCYNECASKVLPLLVDGWFLQVDIDLQLVDGWFLPVDIVLQPAPGKLTHLLLAVVHLVVH